MIPSVSHQNAIGLLIQARMGSTRLPGKVLRPFVDEGALLPLLIRRFRHAFPVLPLVVATSTNVGDDAIAACAHKEGALVFRGDEEDVLERFIGAMQEFGLEAGLRICADNPFLMTDFAHAVLEEGKRSGADYVSHRVAETPAMQTHFGIFTEYITRNALRKASKMAIPPEDRQHVTKFLYENPAVFNLRWIEADADVQDVPDIRLTVDTANDFAIAQALWQKMGAQNETLQWPDLKRFLVNQPELRRRMWLERTKQPK